MVGIYGVLSYAVTQTTQEIGIRMALGGRRGHIIRMVLRYASVLIATGFVIGISVALGAGRLLASDLYEVKAEDPATYAAISSILFATSLLACVIPAWRAMSVDPMLALRQE